MSVVDVSLLCLTAVVSAGVSLIVAVWTTVCTPDSSPDETPRDAHRKFIIGNLSGIRNYRTSVIIKPKSVSNMLKFRDFCLEQFFFPRFSKIVWTPESVFSHVRIGWRYLFLKSHIVSLPHRPGLCGQGILYYAFILSGLQQQVYPDSETS